MEISEVGRDSASLNSFLTFCGNSIVKQQKHFASRATKVGVSACSHVEAFSRAEFKDRATDGEARKERTRRGDKR